MAARARRSRLWVWGLWLVAFYGVWLAVLLAGGYWRELLSHWPIAVAMSAGSYVAGSTPMGGGTVGFPVLVLLLHQPAQMGRDFSFAVQSIGMTSASIFVLSRRQPIAWGLLAPAMLGSLLGTPLGVAHVAPHVPGVAIKLLFACMWASFGLLHLRRTGELAAPRPEPRPAPQLERWLGFGLGFVSGLTVASITGVGIDMVLYAALVLLRRSDLKVAIPTSVIIMAFTSLVGVATKALTAGLQPGVFENWLAAAPIVAVGAPLGAFVVHWIGRKPTLYTVAVLCVGQFVWALHEEWPHLGSLGLLLSLLGLVGFSLAFEWLYRLGRSGEGEAAPAIPPAAPAALEPAEALD